MTADHIRVKVAHPWASVVCEHCGGGVDYPDDADPETYRQIRVWAEQHIDCKAPEHAGKPVFAWLDSRGPEFARAVVRGEA